MSPLVRRKLTFLVAVVIALGAAAYVGRDKGPPFNQPAPGMPAQLAGPA